MTPQFYWGGPEMLGPPERSRRRLAAVASLMGDVGKGVAYVRGQRAEDTALQDEEYKLQQRLADQQGAAVSSATHPDEVQKTIEKSAEPTTEGGAARSEMRQGLLARLAGDVGSGLKRLVMGDPQRSQRIKHILTMQAQLEAQDDLLKRVKAVAPVVKGSPDAPDVIRKVGGERLGIPAFRPAPPTTRGGANSVMWDAAREDAKAATGLDDPPASAIADAYEKRKLGNIKQESTTRADVTTSHRITKTDQETVTESGYVDVETGRWLTNFEVMKRQMDPSLPPMKHVSRSYKVPRGGGTGAGAVGTGDQGTASPGAGVRLQPDKSKGTGGEAPYDIPAEEQDPGKPYGLRFYAD